MTGAWNSVGRDVLERARRSAGGGAALAATLKVNGVGPESGAYSESAVSNWIKGRTRPPADVVLAAAVLYNASLDGPLGLTSPQQPETSPSEMTTDADVQQLRASMARLEALVNDRLTSSNEQTSPVRLRDLRAVFPTRSEAQAAVPLLRALGDAQHVDAMGLSLNGICQGISDVTLAELVENGLTLRCLFLDPDGEWNRSREIEENFPAQHLAGITRANMHVLNRLYTQLSPQARTRVHIRTYDEPLRFNITLFDNQRALVQLYLHRARGLDAPTLLIEAEDAEPHGLYPVFAQVFNDTWGEAYVVKS